MSPTTHGVERPTAAAAQSTARRLAKTANRIASPTDVPATTPGTTRPRTSGPIADHSSIDETEQAHPIRGILVIDDKRLLLQVLSDQLSQRGFRVWTATNGADATVIYRHFGCEIDLVLSDVQMPVMDGPRTFAALREINPLVRLCFMTGNTQTATRAKLLEQGALCVFSKPFPSLAAVADELWELSTRPMTIALAHKQASKTTETNGTAPAKTYSVRGLLAGWIAAFRGLGSTPHEFVIHGSMTCDPAEHRS